MKTYKVCVATSKATGNIIAGLTHIVECDEQPAEYSIENERYYFDYKFFDSEDKAKEYVQSLK